MSDARIPEVYIVESLDRESERAGHLEGKALSRILKMLGKRPRYAYIRTAAELTEIAKEFDESQYRYLHLSCHGNDQEFILTYDVVSFGAFGATFRPIMAERRLFLSACSVGQRALARELFRTHVSSPYSITGPSSDIDFSDAAVTWASLYNLLFRGGAATIGGEHLRANLNKLCELNGVQFAYFGRTGRKPYFRRYGLPSS